MAYSELWFSLFYALHGNEENSVHLASWVPDPVFGSATLGARPALLRARIRMLVSADWIRNIPLLPL
jgi:hypothetical protein